MVKMLVRGGHVIFDPAAGTDGVIEDAGVAISTDGKILAVAPFKDLASRFPDAPVEGDPGYAVVPGLIDAHSHGMGLSYFELGVGYDHLEYWNTVIPGIHRPDPHLDALWCAVKHIRSGCTTIHHMGGASSVEDVQTRISAYEKLNLRWAFSLTVKDQNFLTYEDDSFIPGLPEELRDEAEELFDRDKKRLHSNYFSTFDEIYRRYHSPESPVGLGPMGPQWCSPDLLVKIRAEAESKDARIHMHAIQTPYQNEAIFRRYASSGVSHLAEMGFLGPDLTLGHGVWMSEYDIGLLADTGCSVTHHPACNLNMRNGILPAAYLLSKDVPVALGIDGKGLNDDEDMLAEMRLAEKLHRLADMHPGSSPRVTPARLLQMATSTGAEVLGMQDVCGTLKRGKAADMALIDLTPDPYVHPDATPQQRIVMQKDRDDVRTVIIGGEVVMREGEIQGIDEEKLTAELIDSISASDRAGSRRRVELLQKLRPYILQHFEKYRPLPDRIPPFYPVNRRQWH